MQKPTPRETLPRLRGLGIITSDEESSYLANYEYFEQNRSDIEQKYPGKWVASVNNEFFVGDWYKEVKELIEKKPNCRFAYIEQII